MFLRSFILLPISYINVNVTDISKAAESEQRWEAEAGDHVISETL